MGFSKYLISVDARSNRMLPEVQYSWEMEFNKEDRKINWNKLIKDGNKITFGGLIYQPLEMSASGQCKVNYMNTILYSDKFTFKIAKKDMSEFIKLK